MSKTKFRIIGGAWSDKIKFGAVNEILYSDGSVGEHYFPMHESFPLDSEGKFIPQRFGTGIGVVVRAGEDLEAGKKVYQQEGTTLMYMKDGDKRHELGYAGTDVKEGQYFIPAPIWLPFEGYPAFRKDK